MDSNEDDNILDWTEEPPQTEEFVTDARKKTCNFFDNEDINNNNDEDEARISSKNWKNEENSNEQFSEHSKTNGSPEGILHEESIYRKSFQDLDGLKQRRFDDEFHPQEDQTSFSIRYESIYHQHEHSIPADGIGDYEYDKLTSESGHVRSFLNEMQTINEKKNVSNKFSAHLSTFEVDGHENHENNFPSIENDSEDKARSSELLTGQNDAVRGELQKQELSLDHKDEKTLRENGDPEDFERDKKNKDQEYSGKEDVHKVKIKKSEITKKLQSEQTREIQSCTPKKLRKRVKSVKPRVRSSSDPGEERREDARGALYRPRSHPRIPGESRSGEFDWSTSKNDRIQSWLKQKARLLRKQRAEERKRKKMEKSEKEAKRRQRDEKFVDSVERVGEWMRRKTEQEHRMKEKRRQELTQRQEPRSARIAEYPRLSPEDSLSPDFVLHGVGQDRATRTQKTPLLIQREKQQQALLRSFSKYLDHNRSVAQLDNGVGRKQPSSAKRSFEKPGERLLRDQSYLPAPPARMHFTASSSDQYALRQSLSLSRIMIPSDAEKEGNTAEQAKLKKKITFEEWLKQKKVDDELKKIQMLHRKKLDVDVKELQKSIEVQKMSLASERKSAPVFSARKSGTRMVSESMSRISAGGKPVRDIKLDTAEVSKVGETSRNERGTSAGIRKAIKNSDVARYSYSAFARNAQTNGGMDTMNGRASRAKSPKPVALFRPQSSAGQIQRSQRIGFSKYVWNQGSELEGSTVTTSQDKMRLQSSSLEIDKPEHDSEIRKGEKDEIREEKTNLSILSQDGDKLTRKSNMPCENGRKYPENGKTWSLERAESDICTIIDADDDDVDTNHKQTNSYPEIISAEKTYFSKQNSTEPVDYEPPADTVSSSPALHDGSNASDFEAAFVSDCEVGGSNHSELP